MFSPFRTQHPACGYRYRGHPSRTQFLVNSGRSVDDLPEQRRLAKRRKRFISSGAEPPPRAMVAARTFRIDAEVGVIWSPTSRIISGQLAFGTISTLFFRIQVQFNFASA